MPARDPSPRDLDDGPIDWLRSVVGRSGGSGAGGDGESDSDATGAEDGNSPPYAATDGGSEPDVGDASGTDHSIDADHSWPGDDPITFEDRNPDEPGPREQRDPDDVITFDDRDGTDPVAVDGTDAVHAAPPEDDASRGMDHEEPDADESDGEEPDVGGSHVEEPDADESDEEEPDVDDGAALLEAVTDPAASVPESETPESPDERGADVDALAERVEALEAQQATLQETVGCVETEAGEIRSSLEGLRTDVDRLLQLAAGVVSGSESDSGGPSGALEATDAGAVPEAVAEVDTPEADDAGGGDSGGDVTGTEQRDATGTDPATSDVTDSAVDESHGSDRDSTRPDARSGATAEPPASRDGDQADGSDAGAPGRSDGDADPTAADPVADSDAGSGDPVDAATGSSTAAEPGSSADAESGSSAGSRAGGTRQLVDPTTDAVGDRLRQYREQFDDGSTTDPDGAGEFQFRTVLLPESEGGAPELAGDDLAKPYLEVLPGGYAAEAAVIEWLDWLVSETDRETAARAIGYYASIDWLSADVADALAAYLEDVGSVDRPDDVGPPDAMDMQAHLRSLQYVTALASGEVDADGF